ncbi:PucR family transcriptional regulator [Actinokineospora iranica]|uniref:PucR C-terminal helix-turn-helix domain-containing protein n=1 Tax=Actinokineospora iranica TaxID=1271860 RepID=A0A1G6TLP8_9PSEU|nr:helix-turn-helix domain-containing protein [Actinokineospora iranica]SDD29337.1 PucR C-terminal helix-turn-helix domain-containing protein [Actinokineospora iranica]
MGAPTITSPLPPELVDLAKTQLARLPRFAAELAERLSETDEFYRRVGHDELRAACAANLGSAFHAVIDGAEVDVDVARETGRGQAAQGIPLSAVLRAYRIAGAFTYETLTARAVPALAPEQLPQVSDTVWRIVNRYCDAITAAYREAGDPSTRPQEMVPVLEALLTGQAIDFDAAAVDLKLPPTGPFVVLYCDRVVPEVNAAAWHTVGGAEVAIVVVERAADLRALRAVLDGVPVAVGISPPVASLQRIAAALRRAKIARRCLPPGKAGVSGFSDRPLTTLVAGAPKLALELSHDVLAGMRAVSPIEQSTLLTTLLIWADEGGSLKETADRLFTHPNTIRYRLRRIHELTGRDPMEPRAGAELLMAAEVVRLNGA